jgi:mono/diheme cytochrome c family protein
LQQEETVMGNTRTLSFTILSLLLFNCGWGVAAEPAVEYQKASARQLHQGWKPGWETGQSNWFHHASQGTMMVPYVWFMALEQPTIDPAMPDMGMFKDPEYLSQFGFIPSVQDQKYNPGNLPIGFAIADNWVDPNNKTPSRPFKALGLTCAACHTSLITHQGTRLQIEGGSARIDLTAFQKALGLSLLITNSSSKKFDAFAKRCLDLQVLPPQITEARAKKMLKDELEKAVLKVMKEQKQEAELKLRTVDAGFGRTDALALIVNRVFGKFDSRNLSKANAPVNYPHIWDTPWFYWVQYNASIRLPMVRNIGEALGVRAEVNSDFESTVDVKNLHLMEEQVAGKQPFTGLKAPAWPEKVFGEIDGFKQGAGKWKKGKDLYKKHCIQCHYRIEDYQFALNLDVTDKRYKRHWSKPNQFGWKFMKLPYINYIDLGTDPTTVVEFYQRIVYTGSLDTEQSAMSAGAALAMATSKVRERGYANLDLSPAEYAAYDGYRELTPEPSAISRLQYKARPLNGIWSTAPFLHNGSVANLYELLLPADQRMSTFYVGSTEFDPEHVGFTTEPKPGHFRMNTSLPGNLNTGHEFRDLTKQERASLTQFQCDRIRENKGWAVYGVVGPELKPEQRWALIEYLKSLGSPQPGQEYPPAGEPAAIKKLAGLQMLLQMMAQLQAGKGQRGQHAKSHGVVSARFQVAADLPDRYRVGIFDQPIEYKSVIRFSNGEGKVDQEPDVHGMAIKVAVPTESDPQKTVDQDFVLADNPVFFARNVQHLLEFMLPVMRSPDDKRDAIKKKLAATTHRALIGFKKHLETSPLEATYWSQTPYKFGDLAVKYKVVPSEKNAEHKLPVQSAAEEAKDPNFLGKAMVKRLTKPNGPVSFDFCVQQQIDARKMPIEDPTVKWESRFIKLATITIDPQVFDSPEQKKSGDARSFSPWNALPQHLPLGGINRARRPIYPASQNLRHQTNKVKEKEATGCEEL